MRSGIAYLLVYIAVGDQEDAWADIGNDPDFRQTPFTWGICRTNVRGWAQAGDDLFFVAKRSGGSVSDRYFLRGRFTVSEKIDHVEARRRFGPRQNVIIDELPAGRDLRSRLTDYIDHWQRDLQWNDGRPDRPRLTSGDWIETEFAVEPQPDHWYVHSYWDPHVDWKIRLRSPYLIADPAASRVLRRPVAWADVVARSKHLPGPNQLANKSNRHAAQRVWDLADLELLSEVFTSSGDLTSTSR